jgi:hypothetical protein
VEASRGEADDGGVVSDLVQRGALPGVLGAGELGGGGVRGALLLWVKKRKPRDGSGNTYTRTDLGARSGDPQGKKGEETHEQMRRRRASG